VTPASIAHLLSQFQYATNTETVLQRAVQEVLQGASIPFDRERILSPRDRIEFFLPGEGIGIECKVDGSVNHVIGQLLRYTESDLIQGLVLVTSRNKHRTIPATLGGKPVYVVLTRAF